MAKTVQNVKNSLKFKAHEKSGVLSVKVGIKKFTVPVTARILSDEKYLFLSFPASSELYAVDGKSLVALGKDTDASAAFVALNPGKRRSGRRRSTGAEVSDALAAALKGIPSGYKLGYEADGSPKLVRMRKRRSSK